MGLYKSIKWPDPAQPQPAEEGQKRKPVYQRIAEGDFKATVPENAKRMVKSEQLAMMQMITMIDTSHSIMDNLERRLQSIPRGIARMKTIRSLISQLSLELLNTMPLEQREHMVNQIKGLVTITAVRNQLPLNQDKTFGLFLCQEQLDIVNMALREQCMLCTTEDPGEQAKCPYARLLNVMPMDKINENTQGCGWFHTWEM